MLRRLICVSAVLAAAAVSFAVPAMAANNGTDHIGPIAASTLDGGTCGDWAKDTYNLFFTVHNNGDGTFAVRTEYKDASFVTLGGASPGACETTNHHGSTLFPGINGTFQGFLDGTVTSATYIPTACNANPCTSRTAAIAAIFPGGFYNIATYNFEYNSPDSTLQYHSWHENFEKNSLGEQDIGDIANA
jgi:hypothetical protein